jgi:hypothetical protein
MSAENEALIFVILAKQARFAPKLAYNLIVLVDTITLTLFPEDV